MDENKKVKKITISYSLKDYWRLMKANENKGFGSGILFCAIFTLVWSQVGAYAECQSCYYNILAGLFFIMGMGYRIYAHQVSKKLNVGKWKEE